MKQASQREGGGRTNLRCGPIEAAALLLLLIALGACRNPGDKAMSHVAAFNGIRSVPLEILGGPDEDVAAAAAHLYRALERQGYSPRIISERSYLLIITRFERAERNRSLPVNANRWPSYRPDHGRYRQYWFVFSGAERLVSDKYWVPDASVFWGYHEQGKLLGWFNAHPEPWGERVLADFECRVMEYLWESEGGGLQPSAERRGEQDFQHIFDSLSR